MKKVISIILASCLFFSINIFVSAKSFDDTEGQPCEKAVDVLSSLGIIEGKEDGVYDPESPLTRAEVVTILLRVMNITASTDADMFEDVSDSHWAYKNIGTAYQIKLINGTSETTFSPDDSVTFAQTVKMIVTMLGYGPRAEAEGGYPAGYIREAVVLDLLKGILNPETMNRGVMAMLIYNALDVALFEPTAYGNNGGQYTESANTVLNQYMNVVHYEEVVAASRMLEIKKPSQRLASDEVYLNNGRVVNVGKTDIKNLVGLKCDIYTKIDDEIETVLYAEPVSMAEIVSIPIDDINSLTTSAIEYKNQNGKMMTENLVAVPVVYNGRVKSPSTDDITPDMGSVRIIKNDGQNISAVIVEDIVNTVSDGVDLNKGYIYLKTPVTIAGEATGRIDMVLNGEENHFLYDKDGNDITLEALEKGDILSIIESEDHSLRIAYQCYESIIGTVTEKDNDGNVIISDKEYTVDKNVTDIRIGKEAEFTFDYLGNIADVNYEGISEIKKYGWLVTANVKGGLKKEIGYKIFTGDGGMKTFSSGERLLLNDISVENDEMVEILTGQKDFPMVSATTAKNPKIWDADKQSIISQLVIYETDEEGKVLKKLALAENQTAGTDDERVGGNFSMDFYVPKGNVEAKEWNGTASGGSTVGEGSGTEFILGNVFGRVKITDDTKYFIIPKDTENDNAYSVQAINRVITLEKFRKLEFLSFFDVSDAYVCGAVVRNDYLSEDSPEFEYPSGLTIGIITKVSRGLDADGAVATLFSIYDQDGSEVIAVIDEEMECGYRVCVADVEKDPDWWTKIGDEKVYGRTEADRTRRNGAVSANRSSSIMNIEAGSLEVGDIIGYSLDASNKLKICTAVYRSNPEFCGTMSFNDFSGKIDKMVRSKFYMGGNPRIYGTVRSVNEAGTMVDAVLSYEDGTVSGFGGQNKEERLAFYNLPKSGKFVIWDTKKQIMSTATADDIVRGDTIFSVWETVTQLLTVIIR
ncbi:MAG: S-layer homology domain-containing protein [Ruminococcaceae bacterium]|nr:S-layer homology domain-containing protein [Oscillospiraceae bacterium]